MSLMMKLTNNIYVADFETITTKTEYYKKTNDTKVNLWYLKELYGENDYIGITITDFLNTIFSNNINFVYFHNLSFDGYFLKTYFDNYTSFKFVNNEERLSKNTYTMLLNGSKIYWIKLNYNNKIIKFKCSYLILSNSVENLGKHFNIKKHAENNLTFYDYEPFKKLDDVPAKFIEYIKRDVDIVRLSLVQFENVIKTILQKFKLLKYDTITQISNKLQLTWGVNVGCLNYKDFKIPYNDYLKFNKLMIGGLTSFNVKYQNKILSEKATYIDRNSSYPDIMSKNLPYGNVELFDGTYKDNYAYFYHIKVNYCHSINENIFFMKNWPNKTLDRYIDYGENFECWYWRDEWNILTKLYEIDYKIIATYQIKIKQYLNEYINLLYNEKKKNNDLKLSYKILLNSSYGTHAKKAFYDEITWKDNLLQYVTKTTRNNDLITYEYQLKHPHTFSTLKSPLYVMELINDKETIKEAPHIVLASYITMGARVELINMILRIGLDKVIYFDTDSVIYIGEANLSNYLDEAELGKWKVEHGNIKNVYIKGAKAYYFEDNNKKIMKYSGINSRYLYKQNSIDVFKNNEKLENANIIKKYCNNGIVLIEKDYIPNIRPH